MSRRLLKATATVGSFTLISRVLGFVRDVILANIFGAGAAMDAFLVAFKIPNFMRRLFAEGAFAQAFVPILSEYKTRRSQAEVKDLLDHTCGALGGVLLLMTAVAIVAAPGFIMLFAPGFWHSPDKFQLSSDMLRITFPYLFLISLTALAGSTLNAYGRFAVPAVTPVLLNLSLIGMAWYGSAWFSTPIIALAWGVCLAGVLQLVFQLPFLYRLGLMPVPRFKRKHEGVQRILTLMLPAIFGVSVTQINLLLDTLLASFLVSGSVSWLYYADRLLEFPVGVFGIALATVMLPTLSKSMASNNLEEYGKNLDWSLRWVFLIGLPCTAGLIVLATPVLLTLFYRGEFSLHDVAMSSQSLMAYSVGILGFVLIKILASGFYARQDTRTPVRIAVIAMLTNMSLNLILIWPLAHAGLALATAGAASVNAALLYRALRHGQWYQPRAGWLPLLLRLSAATILMGILLWWGAAHISWVDISLWQRVGYLFSLISAGVVSYFALLWLLGWRLHHVHHS
jgi:putative peptidoglycan lipid II flippase